MRFLCLHSMGTSSQLFKKQTAALRYELGDEHSYLWVQGMLPWPMAPELAGISKPEDPHFAYMDPASAQTCITALDLLDSLVHTQGPFDGVFAFSQGAGLAIQYMARAKLRDPHGPEPFRCAVLVAPTNVGDEDWYRKTGEMRLLKRLPHGALFGTPTALIWGAADRFRGDFEDGCELWGEGALWRFQHEGGHEVPGTQSKSSLRGAIKVCRRAVVSAEVKDTL